MFFPHLAHSHNISTKKIGPFHWWSIAGQFTIWCCFWLRWDNCGSCHVSASLQPAAPSCLWKGQCWDELEPELQARVKHKASKTMDSWQQDVFSGLSLGPRVMVKHSIYSWRGFWWVTEKLSKQVIMGKSTFRTVLWLKRNNFTGLKKKHFLIRALVFSHSQILEINIKQGMGAVVDKQSTTVKELNRATSNKELYYMWTLLPWEYSHTIVYFFFHIILCDSHNDKLVSSGP